MKVDVTDLSPVKKSMAVEVPPEVVALEAEVVLRGYARKARIPGFRPGKVPLDLVRRHFGKEVQEDVRERVVSRSYREAARERGLEPLGDPVLDEITHEEGEPLRFKTTFEVLPPVTPQDYKGVEVRRAAANVADADVDQALAQLRESRTRLVPVVDGVAATGHVLVADVAGRPEEGEPFRREGMLIEVGASDNPPVFNEKLVGARTGDTLEFSVPYPPEGESTENLAGKSVAYTVKVHEIKSKQVPDLDDEFAKDLGDFADLTALKQRIREDLEARRKTEVERKVRGAILDKVLLANPIVLPDVLVEGETRHRLEEVVRSMYMQGIDPEKTQIDWVRLKQSQDEPARKSVHARLILDAIARAETIDVDNVAIDQRIREDARRMGESPDKLRKSVQKRGGLEALRAQMVREKALDLLVAIANIQNEES